LVGAGGPAGAGTVVHEASNAAAPGVAATASARRGFPVVMTPA
jgi:hypothetical protein